MQIPDEVRQARRRWFARLCRIYMTFGVLSIGAGVAIFLYFGLPNGRPDAAAGLIALIFVAFGVARIVLALKNLRRIPRN